ncbi:copper resistance CopC family protein [Asanoa sp. NPDC049518]|uniref:copper resistance CopC family protein n=1 Tax=unclassified Asanoa TaxID=2685164 RepID=UPI00344148B0
MRRRSAAVLAALFLGLVVVVAPAAPAAAHTKLAKSAPAAKSTVTKPVTALTLTFSGLIRQDGSLVVVRGADGAKYQDAEPTALDKTITQPVRPLPVGVVTVEWKTVSGDGHKISGSYTFTNKVAPPEPTPTVEPEATVSPAPPRTEVPLAEVVPLPGDPSSNVVPWAVGGGAVVVAGLVALFLLRRRRAR